MSCSTDNLWSSTSQSIHLLGQKLCYGLYLSLCNKTLQKEMLVVSNARIKTPKQRTACMSMVLRGADHPVALSKPRTAKSIERLFYRSASKNEGVKSHESCRNPASTNKVTSTTLISVPPDDRLSIEDIFGPPQASCNDEVGEILAAVLSVQPRAHRGPEPERRTHAATGAPPSPYTRSSLPGNGRARPRLIRVLE